MTKAFLLFALFTFHFSLFTFHSSAQRTSRILFILDASGSMGTKWQQQVKFELAKDILFRLTDSLNRSNKNIELGLRVLGHQHPKAEHNCTDTKLEIPFAKNNASQFKEVLNRITPKGQTPIAYSLLQAANDFPKDTVALHSIVLITDGVETCNGNACDAAKQLAAKHIAVKPFIVGLGISDANRKLYECVGTFYNVAEESQFSNVMSAVVKQALNKTTLQINLLNKSGLPNETDVPLTLTDRNTHAPRYNWVHELNAKGNPDTLIVDARAAYDLTVHSMPPVYLQNVQLTPGKHNTVAVDLPRGVLQLQIENTQADVYGIQCLVRQSGATEILYAQDFNSSHQYLEGSYDLEILTLPRIERKGIEVSAGKTQLIKIPQPGTLTFTPTEIGQASLYVKRDERLEKIYDFYGVSTQQSLTLQPGTYQLIFRPDKGKQSVKTKVTTFEIVSLKTTMVKL